MKTILKNILSALDRKERKRFAMLVWLDVVVSVLDIVFLALLLWVIQFYIGSGNRETYSILPGWMNNPGSINLFAVFFLLFAVKNIVAFMVSRSFHSFSGQVALHVSRQNLERFQQASYSEFVAIDSSTHIRRIAYQPFDFAQHCLAGFQQLITQSVLILLSMTAIILFNAKLFLLLLIILLPPVALTFYFLKKRLAKSKIKIVESNETSFRYLLDALKGWIEGNVYGRNKFFLQRFEQARENFSRNLFNSISLQVLPSRAIEIFALLGLLILILLATWSGSGSENTFLTIGAFMAAAYKIIPGLVKIINVTGQLKAYQATTIDIVPAGTKSALNNPSAVNLRSLELKDISFGYNGHKIIENLSLSVQEGDFIGIKGASGIGKTTLINIILGFLSPSKGEIKLNGKTVQHAELRNLWPELAYVRQQGFFIHDSISKNISLSDERVDEQHLARAIEVSGLSNLLSTQSSGVAHIVTENGKNISGGQQQRLAIARAIYKNPKLLLLDEPFNEIDGDSANRIIGSLKKMAGEGLTTIMITHDPDCLKWCNKIISLDAN